LSWITEKKELATPPPNNSLDASGGSVFRNLIGPAKEALIRAAASTQTLGGFLLSALPEHAEQKGPTIYSLNIPD
jgi:hypothetical protein